MAALRGRSPASRLRRALPDAEPATRHAEPRPARSETAGRRGRILRAVAVALVVLALAAVALARGRDRFDGYVSSTGDKQEHVLYVGDPVQLVFVDREKSNTPYLAVFADGRIAQHLHGRTGKKGEKSRITVRNPGPRATKVFVRWVVGGEIKARWVLLLRPANEK